MRCRKSGALAKRKNSVPKVIAYIACSVDGYIARRDGDVGWLFHDQDYGFRDFIAGVGAVVMGRTTYEQILSFGDYPWPEIEGWALSRTRAGELDANVRFESGNLSNLVSGLKARQDNNIWLVGGGQVVREFLQRDLVDQLVLSVHPLILGDGIRLFPPQTPQQVMSLVETQAFDTSLVQLTYQCTRGSRTDEAVKPELDQ